MRNHFFTLFFLLMMIGWGKMQAQTTEYYRIMSCKESFSTRCIQDNTNVTSSSYPFLIKEWDADNRAQEWQIMANDDSTGFYIRNRKTHHFIGQNTKLVDKFYVTQFTTSKSLSPAWQITDLGDGQVALSAFDDCGVIRFLNAADLTAPRAETIYLITSAKDSGFAWRIVNAAVDPTGIENPTIKETSLKATVVGNQIIVTGADKFNVYDATGRKMNPRQGLHAGIYIITAGNKTAKVLIK